MNKFRILIVDDEVDMREILRMTLGGEYEVVEAHDGLDALQKLNQAEPDFIILDVMMPLMDGFEACRAIRNHPRFRDVPILFLSAKTDKEAAKEGYTAGANLYLTKPFDPPQLVATVGYFLEESSTGPRPKHYTLEELKNIGSNLTPLPANGSDPAEKRPPRLPRVMVVDEDAAVVDSITEALGENFKVMSANNTVRAIENIIIHEPDFVIIDARLPDKSGFDLCMSLRRNEYHRTTPVFFISAKPSEREKERCINLGANEFLTKPLDLDVLRQKLLDCAKSTSFTRRRKSRSEIRFPETQR